MDKGNNEIRRMILYSVGSLGTFLPWVEWCRSNAPPQWNDRQLPSGFRNRNCVIWFHISGPIGVECGDAWVFFSAGWHIYLPDIKAIVLTFTLAFQFRQLSNFVLVTYCSKMYQYVVFCTITVYHVSFMNSKTKVGMKIEIISSSIIISHY